MHVALVHSYCYCLVVCFMLWLSCCACVFLFYLYGNLFYLFALTVLNVYIILLVMNAYFICFACNA